MKRERSSGRGWMVCLAVVLGVFVWSTPAQAAPAPTRQPTFRTSEKVIIITGKVYKPRVFIFMGKPKLNLNWSLDDSRFKRSFLDHTLDSVWSRPL